MPYRLKHSNKLVIVRHYGEVDCQELNQAADEIQDLIDPADSPYLLVDVREAHSFPDQAEFLALIRQRGARSPLVDKVAYVTNTVHSDTIEAIAMGHINRGISVRVFCQELDALEWLF